MVVNFLQETLKAIRSLGYTVDDIKYIIDDSIDALIMPDHFWKLADFDYDNNRDNCRCNKVNDRLIIEFKDGTRLERDYDSVSESWIYKISRYDKYIINYNDVAQSIWTCYPDGIHEFLKENR